MRYENNIGNIDESILCCFYLQEAEEVAEATVVEEEEVAVEGE